MRNAPTLILGACLLLLPGAAFAQSQPQSKATVDTGPGSAAQTAPGTQPGAVAYPDNPAGTPVAGDKGAPVVTDKAACPTAGNGRCADRPAPSGSASEGTVKTTTE